MNEKEKTPDEALEEIARAYPLLYSQKKMDEWQNLFSAKALVVRVEEGKPASYLTICEAMPEQIEYASENELFLETWESVEINRYGNIAVMKADYTLRTDHEIRRGVDCLNLCRDQRRWLITCLTYEQKELMKR